MSLKTQKRLKRPPISERYSDKRSNPDIANAFFRGGLIEAWGRGIDKMCKACKQHGISEPVISVEEGGVWIRFDFEVQGKDPIKTQVKKLGNTRIKILHAMKNNPKITGPKLAEMLGISITAIEKNIKCLRENGYLERIGGTRCLWKVLDG